jgi:hypothetical protein
LSTVVRTRRLALCSILLAVGLGIDLPSLSAGAAVRTPTIGVYPGYAGVTTLKSHHFNYVVPAGSKITDSIGVDNFTDEAVLVTLYAADLLEAKGGGIAPAQQGQVVSGVGRWFHVKDGRISIPAHGNVTVPFRLSVPNVTVPGVYGAAIVAAYAAPGTGATNGYDILTREALIARVTVPGAIHFGAWLGPLRSHHTSGGDEFSIAVHNTGNVLLTLTGVVRTGDLTRSANSLPLGPSGVYVIPGGVTTLTTRWANPPVLGHDRAQAAVTLHIYGQSDHTLESSIVTLWFVAGWTIGAAVVVALVLLLMIVTRKRRQRRKRQRKEERRAVRQFKATLRGSGTGELS